MKPALLLAALLVTPPAIGSALFEDESILEVTLSGPLSTVIADKRNREEQPFRLSAGSKSVNVAVRIRGNSRVLACPFPPLRLNFRTSELDGTLFEGEDRLKLVTHCRNGSESAADSVLNEFAAYRLFNLMSARSYRVRLLRIRYEDTDGRQRRLDEPHYGFLIESDEGLAARLGGEVAEIEALRFSELDLLQTARLSVFQYLIGNKDWSFVTSENDDRCCHNIDLLHVDGKLAAIPYDFDLAALVNANYRNRERMNQSRRREYSGYCRLPADSLGIAVDELRDLEERVMASVLEVPALTERALERRTAFIAGYFEDAIDRDRLLVRFRESCIGAR